MTIKTVLITGAEGFTGRWLRKELGADWRVVGLGREALEDGDLIADLLEPESLDHAIGECRPDAVVHLAAISFVPTADVSLIYRTNLIGSLNLLQALRRAGTPPSIVLMASSANIYGAGHSEPIAESVCPQPANHYAASKLAMEHMASGFCEDLPIIIARPFNYTGPGQTKEFVVPKIVEHFRRRAPRIELGNIDVERDFSDVRDIAAMYAMLLQRPDLAGQIFNFCSGTLTSLRQIIAHCERITGHQPEINVNPKFLRGNEILRLSGDPQRLQQALGPLPRRDIAETLADMLAGPVTG